VLSERDRIVDQAQGAVLQRSRGPELTSPLRDVVEKRLAATVGLRPESVQWDARRREDGAWVVALSYSARGGARTASWLWQPVERGLTSLNNLATRLGADDAPAGAKRKRATTQPAASRTGSRRAPAKRTVAKSTAKKSTAKKTAAKRTAAKKPATKRAAAKRTTSKVRARPAATRVAKSATAAPKRAETARAATRRAAKRRATAVTKRRRTPRVVEPPVIESPARRTNGRVAVPSWSDVLLGVQAPAATRGRRRS
jgi:hypothetical protein